MSRVQRLSRNLQHHNPIFRFYSATALRDIGGKAVTRVFSKALKNNTDVDIRHVAVQALGESRNKNAIPVLIEAARHDNDSHVQFKAREALKKLGEIMPKSVISALI